MRRCLKNVHMKERDRERNRDRDFLKMEGQDGMYLKKIPNVEHEPECGQLVKHTHIREIFMATREM